MFKPDTNETCEARKLLQPSEKNVSDLEVQLVLALVLGVFALLTFCVSSHSCSISCDIKIIADALLPDLTTAMAFAVRCS
jgi:hypothetical protein